MQKVKLIFNTNVVTKLFKYPVFLSKCQMYNVKDLTSNDY